MGLVPERHRVPLPAGGGFARGKAALNAQPLHSNAARVSQPGWEYWEYKY